MTQAAKTKETVLGEWRIVWMELWGQEYVNLCVPGYIRIDKRGRGEFQFGVVTGSFTADHERNHFLSAWEGSSETDEAFGEIYGTLGDGNGELTGTIEFWEGDESEYRAVRAK